MRAVTESSFLASDGQEIFYRYWKPDSPSDQAVMMFHRGHEHSGRWQNFVDTSELDDCWFFAWDARGHGRTAGERGAAESFSRMVKDADEFAKHIEKMHKIPLNQMAVVGQSVGAVLAATWIHDYAAPVRSLVLATPAFRIKLYIPLAIPALRLWNHIRPGGFIKSYVRPGMLTHDTDQAKAYADDPLVSPQIATNILLDLYDASTRLVNDASAIHTPTLMFVSGKDYVVRQDVQHQFFNRLSSTDKQIEVLDDFYHSTFWEAGRGDVIRRSGDFIRERFVTPTAELPSETAAKGSLSTYEQLKQPPSAISRAWFGLQSLSLGTAGRLSRGVRIGWRDGFDSGQSLDHVYRNRAEGTTPIGRLIDRGYLDSIGWQGIRQRKVNMERLLDEAIAQQIDRFGEITILDIAAGPGRYVLETLKRNESLPIRAILCDRDPGGIAEGKVIAAELGLSDRVEFRQSDAFDPAKIGDAVGDRSVHIAIVSGLYELFPDNQPVQRSLAGVADVLVEGGRLLYTDQPWHPQQEMIARVLPNRDGDPWVMRCRSQAEMDALVREAGFGRDQMLVDRWGIFSVATAVKC
ncbi:bifunctional alpha/beta hydrolase/class I SAM-dependent methyltransferase [Rubripirellula reticaptiva]|uniref:Phospholipase YtpA n=1 Tax=Rubripirellula reticaptiva TaxID=2528013 RepID=A0A5C6F9L0_9BACT|nr:bifunctional alpha/beta hydrolase/class I SAM-dependent methyltransferase [Rubripirellula reticaptiva]TWU57562.1 Phospholipase YtpA [Rubripirellula reticaptiva]